jgi:hypothetical protein
MRITIDGQDTTVPGALTLSELLEGLAPVLDPNRLVTDVSIDGMPVDPNDPEACATRRLVGEETVQIMTETPIEFARARRVELADHLRLIADMLSAAASGLKAGGTAEANKLIAAAANNLGLVLTLDQHLAVLDQQGAAFDGVADAVRRIGPRLTEAERDRRWEEVASLLADELVPALSIGREEGPR